MHPKQIAEELTKVKTKYGFYTTLGNHDGWYDKAYIEELLETQGINVLNNENVKLRINSKEIYITGVEDKMTASPNLYEARHSKSVMTFKATFVSYNVV